MESGFSQVSPEFSALVRKRELSLVGPEHHKRISLQLDDSILRPLLDEQLRECVSSFAQLAAPIGTPVAVGDRLNQLLAESLFTEIPVLDEDHAEAEKLACAEFRRLAATPHLSLPGAELCLNSGDTVIVRSLMQAKMVI